MTLNLNFKDQALKLDPETYRLPAGSLMLGVQNIGGEGREELLLLITEKNEGAVFQASVLACEHKATKERLSRKSEILKFRLTLASDVIEGPGEERVDGFRLLCEAGEEPRLGKVKWLTRTIRLKAEADRLKLLSLMGLVQDSDTPPLINNPVRFVWFGVCVRW